MIRKIIVVFAVIMTVATIGQAVDFPEFYSSVKKQSLQEYLTETKKLGQGLNLKTAQDTILELRNRLDNIYSSWELQFKPETESKILNKLYSVGRNHTESYVRMECAMTLGIIRNKNSLPWLQEMLKDNDDLVRKYVAESIEEINKRQSQQKNEPKQK